MPKDSLFFLPSPCPLCLCVLIFLSSMVYRYIGFMQQGHYEPIQWNFMNYQQRLYRLQQVLKESACDALLVEDKTNLYYLTGLELSAGKLLVYAHGAILFVDNRYLELCRKKSPFPVQLLDQPSLESRLSTPELAFIQELAFDSENTSYKNYEQLGKLAKAIEGKRSDKNVVKVIPLDAPLKGIRLIKDAQEIELLRKAADLGAQGFDFVCSLLREGISEHELATELEVFWKQRGSKTVAFDPIIAFGENSSMPHYRAGTTRLQKGQVVLIDIGVNLNHYHSDMTRMAFFGQPDPRIVEIHAIVAEAQQAALALCHPGTTLNALDAAARELIKAKGYGSNFTHSLGHGVGLNIHEYPIIRKSEGVANISLEAGMVITVEPGIYLPGVGGVRIEDTVVITPSGHENLTKRSIAPVLR